MATNFTEQQLTGLRAAAKRKTAGTANPADKENLSFAQSKGFQAPKAPSGGLPTGFEKISGAEFGTREKQRAAFSDIRPFGEGPGSFLGGKRRAVAPTAQAPTPTAVPTQAPAPTSVPVTAPTALPVSTPQAPQPAAPAQPTGVEAQIAALGKTIQGAQTPGASETALQEQINALISGTDLGVAGLKGQGRGITTGLVRGQQAKLQEQASLQLAPIQRQLALEQGQRQAALGAIPSQIQLLGLQQKAEEAAKTDVAPVTLSAGQSLVNPSTGEVIFQGKDKPVVVGKGAMLVDPSSGIPLFTPGTAEITQNESDVSAWATNILNGTAQLSNVSEEMRTAVNNKVSQLLNGGFGLLTPEQKTQIDKIGDDLRSEQSYKDMLDIQSGFQSVTVGGSFEDGPGDLTMINGFQRMIDPGAVVREGEFKTVAESQGFLRQTLNIPDKLIEGSLLAQDARNKLIEVATALYDEKAGRFNESTGVRFANRANIFNIPPDLVGANFPLSGGEGGGTRISADEINTLRNEGFSQEEINAAGGFSRVGSDTNIASSPGTGNRPQRNNNPGNVKRGGIADKFALTDENGRPLTDETGHLMFPSPDAGFNGLRADVKAKISGGSRVVKSSNPTIAEVGKAFAEDPNWAAGVARVLGVDVNAKAQTVDFDKLINAIARQEGFFA